MNTEKLSRGWALISEGSALISDAYASIEPASAREAVPSGVPAGLAAGAAGPPPAAPDTLATILSECPDHQVPWTVKEGGISRNGKSYPAFWRCTEKTDGEYCQKRPTEAWAKSHPAERAA